MKEVMNQVITSGEVWPIEAGFFEILIESGSPTLE
jgi:hypothetical protein